MKFSAPALLGLFAATTTTHAQEAPGLDTWKKVSSDLVIELHGMRTKKPGTKEIEKILDALKTAYNTVHGPLDDDYQLVGYDLATASVTRDPPSFLESVGLGYYPYWYGYRRYGFVSFGTVAIACNLCTADDDDTAMMTTSSLGTDELPPLADLGAVEDLFCELLRKGRSKVFREAHGCSLTQVEGLERFPSIEGSGEPHLLHPHVDEPLGLSVSLEGLECASEDGSPCRSDALESAVSDAMTEAATASGTAFYPGALRVYQPVAPPPGSLRSSKETTGTLAVLEGSLVDPTGDALPALERGFCGILAKDALNKDALAGLKGCSLGVLVDPDAEAAEPDQESLLPDAPVIFA